MAVGCRIYRGSRGGGKGTFFKTEKYKEREWGPTSYAFGKEEVRRERKKKAIWFPRISQWEGEGSNLAISNLGDKKEKGALEYVKKVDRGAERHHLSQVNGPSLTLGGAIGSVVSQGDVGMKGHKAVTPEWSHGVPNAGGRTD